MMLIDNHGRRISYLRVAVTDRCNLRCYYCMPEQGLDWIPRDEIMSYEEIFRTCTILARMGIQKIRITGGEPFVRKDLMKLLASLSRIPEIHEISITTNGVLTAPYVAELKKYGIRKVNLSLDTVDRQRFISITKRDHLNDVLATLNECLRLDMQVKINCVVMDGKNTEDILPLCELTRELPVSVRFIEEMPFNGSGHIHKGLNWDHQKILRTIGSQFPQLSKLQDPLYSTSFNYQVKGYRGTIGIIAAYSRTFCGTCNRLRITPKGMLQTCLYGAGVMNIKDMIRSALQDTDIETALRDAVGNRYRNGWDAQNDVTNATLHRSMAAIGG